MSFVWLDLICFGGAYISNYYGLYWSSADKWKKKKKEEDCFLQRAMLDPVSPFLSFGGKESCAEGSPLYKIRYTVINAISAVGFQGG